MNSVNSNFLVNSKKATNMCAQKLSDDEIKSCFNNKNSKKIANDIKSCLKFTLEHEDFKPADVFYHILFKQATYDNTSENNKLYCSFIVCISFAVLNVSPFTKMMEDSLDEVIALFSDRSLAFYFHLIFSPLNMVFEENESNKMSEVNLKKLLLKTIAEVHNDINLKNYYSDSKKCLDVYSLGLKKVHTKLKIKATFEQDLFIEKSEISEKIVNYVSNLYREFQLKTVIEYKKEKKFSNFLLEVLQLVFEIFKYNRAEFVKNIIKYWPTSYNYQIPVIKLFIGFFKELNIDEQNSLERELIEIFDQLLIGSEHVVFSQMYARSKK